MICTNGSQKIRGPLSFPHTSIAGAKQILAHSGVSGHNTTVSLGAAATHVLPIRQNDSKSKP